MELMLKYLRIFSTDNKIEKKRRRKEKSKTTGCGPIGKKNVSLQREGLCSITRLDIREMHAVTALVIQH